MEDENLILKDIEDNLIVKTEVINSNMYTKQAMVSQTSIMSESPREEEMSSVIFPQKLMNFLNREIDLAQKLDERLNFLEDHFFEKRRFDEFSPGEKIQLYAEFQKRRNNASKFILSVNQIASRNAIMNRLLGMDEKESDNGSNILIKLSAEDELKRKRKKASLFKLIDDKIASEEDFDVN